MYYVISSCGGVITAMIEQLLTLVGTLVGGGLLGNLVANSKHKNDDKQEIINQLQEDRKYYSEELEKRDVKINALYDRFRELEQNLINVTREKVQAEWERDQQQAKNEILIREKDALIVENKQLKNRVDDLENRVEELEKEDIDETK